MYTYTHACTMKTHTHTHTLDTQPKVLQLTFVVKKMLLTPSGVLVELHSYIFTYAVFVYIEERTCVKENYPNESSVDVE